MVQQTAGTVDAGDGQAIDGVVGLGRAVLTVYTRWLRLSVYTRGLRLRVETCRAFESGTGQIGGYIKCTGGVHDLPSSRSMCGEIMLLPAACVSLQARESRASAASVVCPLPA